jgi:parallel beta-helix repeat protein
MAAAIPDPSGLSDVRVAPLISTTWEQGGNAANYYTPPGAVGDPDNYVCGCVALAGAQIANYWRFPTLSRPEVTNQCYLSDVAANFVSLGGTYDWQNMPADFSSLSLDQKRAVGRLCYDFGVATKMNWGPLPEGSGTLGILLGEAFRDVFGYASAVAYSHDGDVMPDALVERTVLANLDAQSPVALNLDGHTAVADGYGYASGTLYTHINLGWGGVGNVWYNLPEVEVNEGGGSYSSSILDGVVYNIHPTETGELLTGRVLDGNGDPVADATVTAFGSVSGGSQLVATATTDARGIYAFRVAGGRTWTVVATDGSLSGNCSVDVGLSASAACTERTPTGGRITLGVIGNSWGNDITLGAAGTSTILFVDAASGSDANDGRSWSTAKATIQAAIDIVEGSATTNAIVLVADGRYEPITATNNIPFSIHSVNGPEATVIDGSLQWARGVTNRCATLGTNATETATVLGGFTLVNGIPPNTNATSYVLSAGGGSLGGTVIDCILTNNAAKNGGGACYSVLQDCTVSGNVAKFGGGTYLGSLANCVVADNSSASSGGGIYGLNSTVVTNCTISGNRAGTFGGGVSASAATSLIGCTITNNAAGSNGGGCNSGTLSACLIAGNTATAMGGGTYDATALTRCTVTNNVAGTYGGGCYKGSLSFCIVTGNRAAKGGGTSSAALTDCTVAGNTASTSGGGVNGGSATRCGIVNNTATSNGGGSSGAVLDNCVVVHNGAGADGGGAANGALTNCTVYANTALNNGGGIYLASLANCIVWGNTAPQNPAVYAFSSTPCLNSCLDQVLTGDYNVGNIVADPLFVSASDWHLQAGSPCINAGTNDLAVGETDFYGDTRIAGGTVDMGASEYQTAAPATGYAAWATLNSLGAPDAVTEGQPNLIRYVFDRPSGAFSPFTGITFQNGDPVLLFPSFNPDVSGVSLSILSTTNLLDWTHAVEIQLPGPPFKFNGIILQHPDSAPARFYKLKVE